MDVESWFIEEGLEDLNLIADVLQRLVLSIAGFGFSPDQLYYSRVA